MIHSKPTRNETSRTLATAVALGLLVYGSIAVARNFGILQPYELLAYDLGLTVRQMQQPASRYVTIVEVTEPDIAALGRWPLSDEQLSDALERVGAAAPRAIGLDIYRDIEVPPGRERLDSVLRSDARIFSVTKLADDQGPGVAGPHALVGTSRVGFNDVVVDVLNDLLEKGSGLTLVQASGINNRGEIAATAISGPSRVSHAVLLTPVPESSAATAAVVGAAAWLLPRRRNAHVAPKG